MGEQRKKTKWTLGLHQKGQILVCAIPEHMHEQGPGLIFLKYLPMLFHQPHPHNISFSICSFSLTPSWLCKLAEFLYVLAHF
jgi:hypothetical protein